MKPGLIIEGIACKDCSETVEKELSAYPLVETIFNGLSQKLFFVHRRKDSSRQDFMTALSDTPYLLRHIMESRDCRCCKEIQFAFPLR